MNARSRLPHLLALLFLVALPSSAQTVLSTQPRPRPDARVNLGIFPGGTFNENVSVAANGRFVYAVWADCRNWSAGTWDIYFNRSTDGGRTWMPSDVKINQSSMNGDVARDPQIAISGRNVYVSWLELRGGSDGIWLNRSANRGLTWQPVDQQIHTALANPPTTGTTHDLAASGSFVYVTWDGLFCNPGCTGCAVWCASSANSGVTFSAGAKLSGLSAYYPRVDAQGSAVFVAWEDAGAGATDIRLNRSLNGGLSWLDGALGRRIDTGDGAGSNGSVSPRISVSGSNVHVVWGETRTGFDVYVNSSTNQGLTWLSSAAQVNDSTDAAFVYDVDSVGSTVVVGYDGFGDVLSNRSFDGGSTWSGETYVAAGTTVSDLRLAADQQAVAVLWTDASNDLFVTRSNLTAPNWRPYTPRRVNDVRGSVGTPVFGQRIFDVYMSGGQAFVAWIDTRTQFVGGFCGATNDVYCDAVGGGKKFGLR